MPCFDEIDHEAFLDRVRGGPEINAVLGLVKALLTESADWRFFRND